MYDVRGMPTLAAVRLRDASKTLSLRLPLWRLACQGLGIQLDQKVLVNIAVALVFIIVIRGRDTYLILQPLLFLLRRHAAKAEPASNFLWPL